MLYKNVLKYLTDTYLYHIINLHLLVGGIMMENNNSLARFLLTFFLGFIGSIVINHTSLKPEGYTSRTLAYLFLSMITLGIYGLVASICNLFFDPNKERNIGYKKD
jgi:hypothetical protein